MKVKRALRKSIFFLIPVIFLQISTVAQSIPDDYYLVKKYPRPNDIKHGIPGGIITDPTGTYLLVEYDFKPTIVDIYKIKGWKHIHRVSLKGWVYFQEAFFDPNDTNIVYLGKSGINKFYKLNILTSEYEKTHCNKLRGLCNEERSFNLAAHTSKNDMQMIFMPDKYIIKYDDSNIEIYLKK